MNDLISRQALCEYALNQKDTSVTPNDIMRFPSAQTDLITKMQNGIKATDADDAYSCGMRNGIRWCISLLNEKEPIYENGPFEQPEIIRCKDCKYYKENTLVCGRYGLEDDDYCSWAERKES